MWSTLGRLQITFQCSRRNIIPNRLCIIKSREEHYVIYFDAKDNYLLSQEMSNSYSENKIINEEGNDNLFLKRIDRSFIEL